MFFDSTLSLLHIATIFVPLKLKRIDFFLGPTSKLQFFLPVSDQLDDASESNFIVSTVMEITNSKSPTSQYAFLCSFVVRGTNFTVPASTRRIASRRACQLNGFRRDGLRKRGCPYLIFE